MVDSELRKQISREVKRALSDARLSAAAAARKMGDKDGKLVYRWINAEVTAPLENLAKFASAIGQPVVIRLGPETQDEAAPDVPERLKRIDKRLGQIENAVATQAVIEELASPARLRRALRLLHLLEESPLPADEADPEEPETEDRAGEERRAQ